MDVGQQIDKFTIIRFITRGGMADVYEARQEELKRRVALKIMLPTYAEQSDLVLRFHREGQATARLSHANIIQIYATGTTPDGLPYLAMEFCPQGTLGQWLEKLAQYSQLLQTEHALAIARQIADALRVAHDQRIIHRDLKPSNILIRQDGSVVLADLGIAAVHSATRITSTGTILGTPQYMSPEQASGGSIDGRSDIYSLGIVLYEMLAGCRPFDAEESLAVLHKQIYENPTPLQRIRPGLPNQVYRIANTCLQKKPGSRYQKANQLVTVLDNVLQGLGAGNRVFYPGKWAAPGSQGYLDRRRLIRTPTKFRSKSRQWYELAAIPLIIILLLAGSFLVISDGSPAPIPLPISRTSTVPGEIIYTPTSTPPSTKTPTVTQTTPTPTASPVTPSVTPTATPPPILTNSRIAFVSDRNGLDALHVITFGNASQAQHLTTSIGSDWWPAWCSRNQLVFERADDPWEPEFMEVAMVNTDGSNLQLYTSDNLPPGSDMNGSPSCSPDNRYLAFSSRAIGAAGNDFKVGMIDLTSASPGFALLGDGYSLGGHVSWSPDGEAVVFMHYIRDDRNFHIYRVDLKDPYSHINLSSGYGGSCKYPSWSPDGRQVAFACSRQVGDDLAWDLVMTPPDRSEINVLLRDLHTGGERYDDRRVVRHAITPSWSPDSLWIVFSSDRDGDWDIYAFSIQTGELVNLTEDWPSDEIHPSWGPG